jgi:hypothetical protein
MLRWTYVRDFEINEELREILDSKFTVKFRIRKVLKYCLHTKEYT